MSQTQEDRYTVYKLDVSYFSGKLEAYLRYKEIPHRPVECTMENMNEVGRKTGTRKVPAIEMADGKWLFDTTPTIRWLDEQHAEPPVFPDDPALRFIALLIEDYGDEWLWRPAMWWRWVPKASRVTLGRRIASLYSEHLAIPFGFYFGRRQLHEWLWGDGVDRRNSDDVRDMLFRELEFLEPLFEEQPFILGSHPSIADFGYFGSFFRHFGNDPISAEVMRGQGPNTYEWLSRLWNTRHSKLDKTIASHSGRPLPPITAFGADRNCSASSRYSALRIRRKLNVRLRPRAVSMPYTRMGSLTPVWPSNSSCRLIRLR